MAAGCGWQASGPHVRGQRRQSAQHLPARARLYRVGHNDPEHNYDGDRVAYNGGAMDGFLRAGETIYSQSAIYTEADLLLRRDSAQLHRFNRYFVSAMAPTFPNRMFLWAAQNRSAR